MHKSHYKLNLNSLFRGRPSLITSTVVFQLSMLLFFFILKLQLTSRSFADFLVLIALAAIIGAVASLRSEILITQSDGALYKRTLVWPILIALIICVISWAAGPLVGLLFSVEVDPHTGIIAFGFALQAIGQFLLIQEERFGQLLILRTIQAGILTCVSLLAFCGLSAHWFKGGFAFAMIAPFAVWAGIRLVKKTKQRAPAHRVTLALVRRSMVLSLTSVINTSAVNIPIILCAATQSATYAADFGFLMKLFAAPVTLANAMFGQLFLAENIKRDILQPKEALHVRKSMHGTSMKATLFVTFISIGTIAASYILAYWIPSILNYPSLAIAISFAVVAQAGFSPVSFIGDIAKLENPFLIFYVARIAMLYGLLSSVTIIDYSALFAATNIAVYLSFWVYADWRLKNMAAPTRI